MGDFYGYNPAEYQQDFSFIDNAVESLGSAAAMIPEIKAAKQQMRNDANYMNEFVGEYDRFIDFAKTDESMRNGVLNQWYDGVSSEDASRNLLGRGESFEGVELVEDNGDPTRNVYTYNGQQMTGETWNEVFGQQIARDLRRGIPEGTIIGRDGETSTTASDFMDRQGTLGRLRGTTSSEEFTNRVAQNFENYLNPIIQSGNLDQGVLYAMTASGEYGGQETISSINAGIEDRRQENMYNDFKEELATTEVDTGIAPMISMVQGEDGLVSYQEGEAVTLPMSSAEARQRANEMKLSHSATEDLVTRQATEYDTAATQIAMMQVDRLMAQQMDSALASFSSGAGKDFWNADVADLLQNTTWSPGSDPMSVIMSGEYYGEMSGPAQQRLEQRVQDRMDRRQNTTIALFQRKSQELQGNGGGRPSVGFDPFKPLIDVVSTKLSNIDDQIGALGEKDKLTASEARTLEALKTQRKQAQFRLDAYGQGSSQWRNDLGVYGIEAYNDIFVTELDTNVENFYRSGDLKQLLTDAEWKQGDPISRELSSQIGNAFGTNLDVNPPIVRLATEEDLDKGIPNVSRVGDMVIEFDMASSVGGAEGNFDMERSFGVPRDLTNFETPRNVPQGTPQETVSLTEATDQNINNMMSSVMNDLIKGTGGQEFNLSPEALKELVSAKFGDSIDVGSIDEDVFVDYTDRISRNLQYIPKDGDETYIFVGNGSHIVPSSSAEAVSKAIVNAGYKIGSGRHTLEVIRESAEELGILSEIDNIDPNAVQSMASSVVDRINSGQLDAASEWASGMVAKIMELWGYSIRGSEDISTKHGGIVSGGVVPDNEQ